MEKPATAASETAMATMSSGFTFMRGTGYRMGGAGFEPATPSVSSWCSNQTELAARSPAEPTPVGSTLSSCRTRRPREPTTLSLTARDPTGTIAA